MLTNVVCQQETLLQYNYVNKTMRQYNYQYRVCHNATGISFAGISLVEIG